MTRTDENREHCKHIAEELEQFASGELYRCPHCGEYHTWEEYEETEHENADGITCYTCPYCDEEVEENEEAERDLDEPLFYDSTIGYDGDDDDYREAPVHGAYADSSDLPATPVALTPTRIRR